MPKLSDKDLLAQFIDDWRDSEDAHAAWSEEAEEDFAFYAGHQWDTEDEATLISQNRPVITFNRIQPFIRVIVGIMIQNRGEPKFLPRTSEDQGVNDVLTQASMWMRDSANSEHYETKAAQDMLITGLGVTDERISYEDNPDGTLKKERIKPTDMGWHRHAREINLLDARFVFRKKENVPKEEAREVYGVTDEDLAFASNANPGSVEVITDEYEETQDATPQSDNITVYEYQYRKREAYFRLENPFLEDEDVVVAFSDEFARAVDELNLDIQNPVWSLTREEYDKMKDFSELGEPVEGNMWAYYRAFISGSLVLESTEGPLKNQFSFKFMTGEYDEEDDMWYGLVRSMKDPARYANKSFSQLLHAINAGPKGGLIVEKGAVDNVDLLEQKYSSTDSVIVVNDGALTEGRVIPKAQAQLPTGYEQVLDFSIGANREVTGVNMELLGQRNANQPGILEAQRIQQGMTALAPFMDAVRLYMRETGKAAVQFIKELSENVENRLIRIIDKGEFKYIPLTSDRLYEEYDVIIDEAKLEQNQDREDLKAISGLLQTGVIQPTPTIQMALIEKFEIRSELKEKINAEIEAQATGGPSEVDIMAQQLSFAKEQAELANKQADTFKKEAEAAKARAEAAEKGQEIAANRLVTGGAV